MSSSKDKENIVNQFNQYGNMVLRIAMQNTGNMSEAEDITQDVFVKLLKERKKISDAEHIKAWLIRVTINQCKDYLKSSRFRMNIAYTEENLGYKEESFDLEQKEIFEELRKLPQNYRNVIYLYYIEEYTVPEIAELLVVKKNTVSSWLRRAKKKLKMNMKGENLYEEGDLYCSDAKN